MLKDRFQEARDLIDQRRFVDARVVLEQLDHPIARDWIAKIDKTVTREAERRMSRTSPKYGKHRLECPNCGSHKIKSRQRSLAWVLAGGALVGALMFVLIAVAASSVRPIALVLAALALVAAVMINPINRPVRCRKCDYRWIPGRTNVRVGNVRPHPFRQSDAELARELDALGAFDFPDEAAHTTPPAPDIHVEPPRRAASTSATHTMQTVAAYVPDPAPATRLLTDTSSVISRLKKSQIADETPDPTPTATAQQAVSAPVEATWLPIDEPAAPPAAEPSAVAEPSVPDENPEQDFWSRFDADKASDEAPLILPAAMPEPTTEVNSVDMDNFWASFDNIQTSSAGTPTHTSPAHDVPRPKTAPFTTPIPGGDEELVHGTLPDKRDSGTLADLISLLEKRSSTEMAAAEPWDMENAASPTSDRDFDDVFHVAADSVPAVTEGRSASTSKIRSLQRTEEVPVLEGPAAMSAAESEAVDSQPQPVDALADQTMEMDSPFPDSGETPPQGENAATA